MRVCEQKLHFGSQIERQPGSGAMREEKTDKENEFIRVSVFVLTSDIALIKSGVAKPPRIAR